ncbi:hypothetical protein G436_4494 [Leptospira interrogans serovar Hardjo str. Norma]|uniref:Uncharacterized protein n=1 Tax=Leptospira interrogans serovar Hardjo str. Norma TaxID=1279460 RepID=A0A0M3TMX9_LEPIR|nr:hypothetical protein G436_4494 [Leptospira interrogans serovar Hardjo str. Norma]EKO94609.1 hypothetical protein LEP1GSC057_2525 [Leptospira interrogans str. Brem 329]
MIESYTINWPHEFPNFVFSLYNLKYLSGIVLKLLKFIFFRFVIKTNGKNRL